MKKRFKMYKSGRLWVTAAATTGIFAVGMLNQSVSADETPAGGNDVSSTSASQSPANNSTSINANKVNAGNSLTSTNQSDTNSTSAIATNVSMATSKSAISSNTANTSMTTNQSAASLNTSNSTLGSVQDTTAEKQLSNLAVTINTNDGTSMSNGSTVQLQDQSPHINSINLSFTLTQDGSLTPGTQIKIPVGISNNSYALPGSAISSGSPLVIKNVGTVEYQKDDHFGATGYYILTIGDQFDQTVGKKVDVSLVENPSPSAALVATDSSKNIVINIGDSQFNFVPAKRQYAKDDQNFKSGDFAYSATANTVNTGTNLQDSNYLNNMLESNGKNPGNTNIPSGNLINIQRVQASGSAITGIFPGNYLGSHTLEISEDGKYVVSGDNSVDYNFSAGTGVTNLVELPKNATNDEIIVALNKAGKHSGVIIYNDDGTYTLAYNFGNLIGDGAYTYHDLYTNDDAATVADQAQEINRSPELNNQLNQTISKLNVINFGIQSVYQFSDSSIVNTLSGQSTLYSVNEDNTNSIVSNSTFGASTTPSNARSEGQNKITVHYIDQQGKEISTQQYSYGYPSGSNISSQSPDFSATPENIKGYTLITNQSLFPSDMKHYLTTSESIAFSAQDQDFYYVYQKNAPTVTTDTKTVNETVHYQYADGTKAADDYVATPITFTRSVSTDAVTGEKTYGNWTANQNFTAVTSPTLKGYTPDQTSIAAQNVTGDSSDLVYTVKYTKDAPTVTTESKTVNETIHYQYADGTKAADDYVATPITFTRTVSTDAVTGEKTYGAWTADQSFAAVTSPTLKGYTADQTSIAAQNVTPDSNDLVYTVKYTKDAPTRTTDTKTVNETVHYRYADGTKAADDYVATPITFTRTVSTDAVTGEKTYGAWTADQSFAAVTSPTLKGYTADQTSIAAQNVTPDSNDLVYTVKYTKDAPTRTTTATTDSHDGNTVTSNQIDKVVNPQSDTNHVLPNTGLRTERNKPNSNFLLALIASFAGLGIFSRRKRNK
ncbi:mucin-binding protein [Fructobacillus cardui]|uniref:mucin-binding protein n=1 Tax=Fructobacillus cardui TaxID=2893170 RepID=UPI002D9099C7|nr:Clumping factor A-related surface protein [Fructobacillus cardui]